MATNLGLDPELLDRAFRLSGERTSEAAVTRAQMLERLSAIDLVQPDLDDHVEFALWPTA